MVPSVPSPPHTPRRRTFLDMIAPRKELEEDMNASASSDSDSDVHEVNTQPLNQEDAAKMNEAANAVYATLVPLPPNSDLPTIHVDKEMFTIGRDKCQVNGTVNAKFVSRRHFSVERVGENTFVKNLSDYSTYVNEIKVGNGQRHPLPQDAIIGFSQMDKSYKFIRKEYGHGIDYLGFPAGIRDKYVVGKFMWLVNDNMSYILCFSSIKT